MWIGVTFVLRISLITLSDIALRSVGRFDGDVQLARNRPYMKSVATKYSASGHRHRACYDWPCPPNWASPRTSKDHGWLSLPWKDSIPHCLTVSWCSNMLSSKHCADFLNESRMCSSTFKSTYTHCEWDEHRMINMRGHPSGEWRERGYVQTAWSSNLMSWDQAAFSLNPFSTFLYDPNARLPSSRI